MAPTKLDGLDFLRKHLSEADGGDRLRELVLAMAEKLMGAEVDALCGAGRHERTEERSNSRNGYRERRWDTRAGTTEVPVPKLRQGSYMPSWLFEPRRRAEQALVSVVADCYLRGVSTRRVDALVKTMGSEGISKSQVAKMAQELDETVREFRQRPLDCRPYPYLWLDALVHKCREGGRIVNVATVVAVGVVGDLVRLPYHVGQPAVHPTFISRRHSSCPEQEMPRRGPRATRAEAAGRALFVRSLR